MQGRRTRRDKRTRVGIFGGIPERIWNSGAKRKWEGKGEAKPGLRGLQLRKAWLSGPFCFLHLGPRHFRQTGESRVSLLAGAISGALRLRGGSPAPPAAASAREASSATRGRGVVRGRSVGVPWAWLPSRLCPPTPQQLPPPPAARTEGAVLPPPARPGAASPGCGGQAGVSSFLEELLGEASDWWRRGGRACTRWPPAASRCSGSTGCSLSAPCAQLSASLAAFYGRLRGDGGGAGTGPGAGASASPSRGAATRRSSLRVLGSGPAAMAGLRAGHAVAGYLQGEAREGERRRPRRAFPGAGPRGPRRPRCPLL